MCFPCSCLFDVGLVHFLFGFMCSVLFPKYVCSDVLIKSNEIYLIANATSPESMHSRSVYKNSVCSTMSSYKLNLHNVL